MVERRGLADVEDVATGSKQAVHARGVGQGEPQVARQRPDPARTLRRIDGRGEPFAERAPGGDALRVDERHQLPPDECRGLHVTGAAAQGVNRAAEVPREGTQAAAGQVGQQALRNVVRADDIDWRHAAGQRAEERQLESREVDDRRRGLLRETRRLVRQPAPGDAGIDTILHHALGDARDPRHGWWDALAVGKPDQAGAHGRGGRADTCPAELEEMPARRRGGGLTVDHQHLELRERQDGAERHGGPSVAHSPYVRLLSVLAGHPQRNRL